MMMNEDFQWSGRVKDSGLVV